MVTPQAMHTSSKAASPWRPGLAAALLSAAAVAAPAAERAMLTLLEGEATVVDGVSRSAAAIGQTLAPAAMLETRASDAFVRVELPDRTAIDLGPGTKAMISPPGFPARAGHAPVLYLLQGWAKVTAPDRQPVGGVVAPMLELMPVNGVAVLQVDRSQRHVFAETGALELLERPGGKRVAVPNGQYYAGSDGVAPRPTAGFLATVPRAFRDQLPLRAAALKDKAVAAVALPTPTYAALADWLTAEPAVRRAFPHRFGALARDGAFRQQLQAHLSSHPEWGTVLNPPPPKPEVTR